MKKLLVLSIIIFITSSVNFAQTYGEIFDKNEADQLFGPVLHYHTITYDQLKEFVSETNTVIMLKVYENDFTVLGDDREVIYPIGKSVPEQEIFSMYSVSKVKEFLEVVDKNIINIEQRKDVLSITGGSFTLEKSTGCPPYCK